MSLFITDLILPHQTNKPGSRPELKPLEKKMLLNKASMKVDTTMELRGLVEIVNTYFSSLSGQVIMATWKQFHLYLYLHIHPHYNI